ncbi:AAA family ATPase [Aquabacterium fontiphilum]|uniref:ExeA family protein n=1 Tax=Aquabacterium fontiphilum TaxID=450365 RepID=UPI001378F6FA|nr:AAA family ATPase [Aquabacterium fontiphilum]NBD20172.1 AAA family ATPase [Aquabacterium fontiphilum]
MYASHFGLKQAPFSIAPDPRYLFMSERHREALAHLLYGVGGGGGFVLLTGAIGAGKTTVCRCFLEQIPRRCNVAYIFNPKLSALELLRTVCEEFRIPPPDSDEEAHSIKALVDRINEYLLRTHAVGQNNVLIIDEAQNLSAEVIEQLRLLTNLETSERKLLQIILIGQPELRDMLARPELEQVAQRVIARFHLDALSAAETAQYIQHRLAVAGHRRGRLFTDDAVRRIHAWTHGVPRRINLLCDRALLGAYAEGRAAVDRRIVDKAADEVFAGQTHLRPPHAGLSGSGPRWPAWAPRALLAGSAALMLGSAALVAGWWWMNRPAASPKSESVARSATKVTGVTGAASAGAPAPPASTPASGGPAPVKAPPNADAAEVVTGAWPRSADGWRALAGLWGATAEGADPCTAVRTQSLWCFQGSGGLPQLQQLDRPALLVLRNAQGQTVHAVLLGLGPDRAELLLADGPRSVTLGTLAAVWRGEFGTFWRAPEGYRGRLERGQRGPAVDWLAAQLARHAQEPAPAPGQTFDAALQARVQAFQLSQGLQPDGVAGAGTMMMLNRVADTDEPRLTKLPANRP